MPVGRHLFVALLALASASIAFAGTAESTTSSGWHPVEQIAAAAEDFLRDRTQSLAGETDVRAGLLDSRHRLARCDQPLQAFLRSGTEIRARTIVGVRCEGRKSWKVYVPVDVVVTANVLVARQTLVKGQVLSADDLATEQRDVSRVRGGYLSDAAQVIGLRVKTLVLAGKTLKPAMLQADIAIKRGQSVTLTANTNGFAITMAGTALMDGALNQRIRVQNNNSGRVIEGIVRSREQVEVLLSRDNSFFHAGPKVSPPVADTGFSNNDR
tara:strand:+ start:60685 stop:61491 length:807 start_codon:yes stop_codon:yes gene_type:complete